MKTRRLKIRSRIRTTTLPKFWQPHLQPSEKLDCKLIHWDLIDRITNGSADKADLWDWMETGFTYSQLMRLLMAEGVDFTYEAISAVNSQLCIYEDIATRCKKFSNVGFIGFTASEFIIARAAASVFDDLIELDRNGCAIRAALWSQQQMLRIMGIAK